MEGPGWKGVSPEAMRLRAQLTKLQLEIFNKNISRITDEWMREQRAARGANAALAEAVKAEADAKKVAAEEAAKEELRRKLESFRNAEASSMRGLGQYNSAKASEARNAWLERMNRIGAGAVGYRFLGALTKTGVPIAERISDSLRGKQVWMEGMDAARTSTTKGPAVDPLKGVRGDITDLTRSWTLRWGTALSDIGASLKGSADLTRMNSGLLARLTGVLSSGLGDVALTTGQKFTELQKKLGIMQKLFIKPATPLKAITGIIDRAPVGEGKGVDFGEWQKSFRSGLQNLPSFGTDKVQTQRATEDISARRFTEMFGESNVANKTGGLRKGQRLAQQFVDMASEGLIGEKAAQIKLPKGDRFTDRVGTATEAAGTAKADRNVKRATANLKGQIEPGLAAWGEKIGKMGFAARYSATRRVAELPGALNKVVNWVFIGIIVGAMFSIIRKWILNEYDPTDSANNRKLAFQAFASLTAMLVGAVILWIAIGVILRLVLTSVAGVLAAIPTPFTWAMSATVFAFKFWAVDFLLANIGKWFPTLGQPNPEGHPLHPYFPHGIFPPHPPLSLKDVMNLKDKAIKSLRGAIGTAGLTQQATTLQQLTAQQGGAAIAGGVDFQTDAGGRLKTGRDQMGWDTPDNPMTKWGKLAPANPMFIGDPNKTFRQDAILKLKKRQKSLGSWFQSAAQSGALGGAWSTGGTLQDHIIGQLKAVQIAIQQLSTVVAPLPNNANGVAGSTTNTSSVVQQEGDQITIINQRDPKLARDWPLGKPNEGIPY